jgi:inositol 3-alpha-galactosyltransferase
VEPHAAVQDRLLPAEPGPGGVAGAGAGPAAAAAAALLQRRHVQFVHEPSLRTARDLLDALAATPPTPFAEQDFLNLFFRDAYAPLPPTYNLVLAMLWRHPDRVAPALHEVKVVHYCAAGAKPWRYTGKEPNMEREDVRALVAKWWDIFDDESLDYDKQQGAAPPVEDQARLPLRQAMAQAGPFKHFPAPSAA